MIFRVKSIDRCRRPRRRRPGNGSQSVLEQLVNITWKKYPVEEREGALSSPAG